MTEGFAQAWKELRILNTSGTCGVVLRCCGIAVLLHFIHKRILYCGVASLGTEKRNQILFHQETHARGVTEGFAQAWKELRILISAFSVVLK